MLANFGLRLDIRVCRALAKLILFEIQQDGAFFLRRVYYMNTKRKQIVQEALLQMRATSKALGPEFLTRIRMLIKDCDPAYLQQILGDGQSSSVSEAPVPWSPAENIRPDQFAAMTEPVDKKKNLLIIMKFLQLKQDNKNVQTQVRTLLAETNTIQ